MKKLLTVGSIVILLFGIVPISFAAHGVQAKMMGCTANQTLPDPACTPGAVLTTDVSVICKSGYTKTVRDVPLSERKKVFAEYGIPYSQSSKYEVDHLISLEIGGSNDISNLWPEESTVSDGSLTKDKLENYLHTQVCSGKMTITEAQAEISSSWITYYPASLAQKTPSQKIIVSQPKAYTFTAVPTPKAVSAVPKGSTGQCQDGTYTYTVNHKGACSRHKGVKAWF